MKNVGSQFEVKYIKNDSDKYIIYSVQLFDKDGVPTGAEIKFNKLKNSTYQRVFKFASLYDKRWKEKKAKIFMNDSIREQLDQLDENKKTRKKKGR